MEGFCRGCFIKYDETEEMLQYTERNRRLYVYSTGLQVKRNDPFTFQLCKECYISMKNACKFKKKCRNSDKRFKSYLALKDADADDSTDISTFLKNNDDPMMFKFPLMGGNSTPAYSKVRDDDNESTCTSIRNFMSDLAPAEDIPDSEARIIREVIEEEADLLDDSLDSHWLNDDVSIATDFQLDVSLSSFSTPRSDNDRFNQGPELDTTQDRDTIKKIAQEIMQEAEPNAQDGFKEDQIETEKESRTDSNAQFKLNSPHDFEDYVKEDQSVFNAKNFYIDSNLQESGDKNECVIDKNLEDALKDEDNQEFPLEDLVRTPEVNPYASAMSTPTLNNLLFGDKLDINYGNSESQNVTGQCIEPFKSIESDDSIDILKDFLNQESPKYINSPIEDEIINVKDVEYDHIGATNILHPTRLAPIKKLLKYDLSEFLCNICNRKFTTKKGLKTHFTRHHHDTIVEAKKVYKREKKFCDHCGGVYHDFPTLIRHIRNMHMKPVKEAKCINCQQVFTSAAKLRIHMRVHGDKTAMKLKKKKYICGDCGAAFAVLNNLTIHARRHRKEYVVSCDECGKGFYRAHDLKVHARMHNDNRPFSCSECGKAFRRRDTLNSHMKIHNRDFPVTCHLCGHGFLKKQTMLRHAGSIFCRKRQELAAILKNSKPGQIAYVVEEPKRRKKKSKVESNSGNGGGAEDINKLGENDNSPKTLADYINFDDESAPENVTKSNVESNGTTSVARSDEDGNKSGKNYYSPKTLVDYLNCDESTPEIVMKSNVERKGTTSVARSDEDGNKSGENDNSPKTLVDYLNFDESVPEIVKKSNVESNGTTSATRSDEDGNKSGKNDNSPKTLADYLIFGDESAQNIAKKSNVQSSGTTSVARSDEDGNKSGENDNSPKTLVDYLNFDESVPEIVKKSNVESNGTTSATRSDEDGNKSGKNDNSPKTLADYLNFDDESAPKIAKKSNVKRKGTTSVARSEEDVNKSGKNDNSPKTLADYLNFDDESAPKIAKKSNVKRKGTTSVARSDEDINISGKKYKLKESLADYINFKSNSTTSVTRRDEDINKSEKNVKPQKTLGDYINFD